MRSGGCPVPRSCSEKQIGESADSAWRSRATPAPAPGGTFEGVGINVNLAPVLDVYRQPGNFIDEYQRSYSSSPRPSPRSAAHSSPLSSGSAWPRRPSTSPASEPLAHARTPIAGPSR